MPTGIENAESHASVAPFVSDSSAACYINGSGISAFAFYHTSA